VLRNAEGTFARRLKRWYRQELDFRLPDAVAEEVGNIASRHVIRTEDIEMQFTRRLNMRRENFAHGDSCWWTCYSGSRCLFKQNGGIGVRLFKQTCADTLFGRFWLVPMDGEFRGLHDPMEATQWMVFNSYADKGEGNGSGDLMEAAQLFGLFLAGGGKTGDGKGQEFPGTYKKVGIRVRWWEHNGANPYINNRTAVIVAPQAGAVIPDEVVLDWRYKCDCE
jgi:hypothetical protein